jgi:hypothetical protein
MSYVLTPMTLSELKEFFDDNAISVIYFFIRKSLISQPEKIPDQKETLPIHIPKEHIEQWIVQALSAQSVGHGSYPVDVIKDDWGADVKMLSCKINKNDELMNSDSGETSLGQKFSDDIFEDGKTLDQLFVEKDFVSIWNSWKMILHNKYKKLKDEHGISQIYFFIILRAGYKFHLCGIKVDLSVLDGVTINEARSTKTSVFLDEYIDINYGMLKIYKSKKRLELRLKPKKLVDDGHVLTFDPNFNPITKDIRKLVVDGTLDNFIIDELVPLLKE